jgi:hypothetical protein
MNVKKGDDMKRFCNSLLLCGLALLWVPVASAQDVVIRRVDGKSKPTLAV